MQVPDDPKHKLSSMLIVDTKFRHMTGLKLHPSLARLPVGTHWALALHTSPFPSVQPLGLSEWVNKPTYMCMPCA